jgi:hypothetical protein
VQVPCIDLGGAQLYFFPDVVLYRERGTYGGIPYSDLRISHAFTQFIEEGAVPADATIVGTTWRYVNKAGGPDRRFNNNRQIPIARYGVLVLSSSKGLNIHLHTSNASVSTTVADAWEEVCRAPCAHDLGRCAPDEATVADGPIAQACRVLGVAPGATAEEIGKAYHRLAQQYHPDKVADLAPEFQRLADQRMKEINQANDVLKDGGTGLAGV